MSFEDTGGTPVTPSPAPTDLWLTVAEADEYLAFHPNAVDYWEEGVDLASGLPTKTMCLVQAQRQLVREGAWTLDDPDDGEEQDQAIKDAISEQALFILRTLSSYTRTALQSQGVVAAGIMQETYDGAGGRIPICPEASALLDAGGYKSETTNFFTVEV